MSKPVLTIERTPRRSSGGLYPSCYAHSGSLCGPPLLGQLPVGWLGPLSAFLRSVVTYLCTSARNNAAMTRQSGTDSTTAYEQYSAQGRRGCSCLYSLLSKGQAFHVAPKRNYQRYLQSASDGTYRSYSSGVELKHEERTHDAC